MLRNILRVVVTSAIVLTTGVLLYTDDRVLGAVITGLAAGLLVIGVLGILVLAAFAVRSALRLVIDEDAPPTERRAEPLRTQTASGRP
ncbi:hypothetical protein [Rhodoplanes roseus]|uniref:Uncharacterized protein n=1 Tax=Rhodoplanes roseus TaxID=29409 RepID=A0A327LC29_9BRAD|nr:hypothetical protein [Rhodoplanes roseus]RAI45308.1 hypothetical protein CH341_04765 [Rhodoplanes roseus]